MLPFASGAAASSIEVGATLVGSAVNSNPVLSTLGAVAGDLLLVYSPNGSVGLTSGGTLIGMGGGGYYRLLDSSDVAGSVSSSLSFVMAVYRGAVSAQRRSNEVVNIGVGFTNRSLAGFVKDAKHYGIVAFAFGSLADSILSVSLPATMTQRQLANPGVGGGSGGGRFYLADRLQPQNPYYVSGTPFTWSSGSDGSLLSIYELRSA